MQDLSIKLKLESDQFRRELNSTKSLLSSFGKDARKGFGSIGEGFNTVGEKLNKMGGTVGKLGGTFTKLGGTISGLSGPFSTAFNIMKKGYEVGTKANKEFIADLKTAASAATKVGVAAGGAFALIAKEGMAFEDQMAQVKAITGSTEEDFAKLTETARD